SAPTFSVRPSTLGAAARAPTVAAPIAAFRRKFLRDILFFGSSAMSIPLRGMRWTTRSYPVLLPGRSDAPRISSCVTADVTTVRSFRLRSANVEFGSSYPVNHGPNLGEPLMSTSRRQTEFLRGGLHTSRLDCDIGLIRRLALDPGFVSNRAAAATTTGPSRS